MNFTAQYNRAHLAVANPQLNWSPGELRMGKKHFASYKNMQSYGNFPNPSTYNVPKSQKPPSPFNPQSRYIPYQHSAEASPEDIPNSRPADYYYPPALKSSSKPLPYTLSPNQREYPAYMKEDPYHNRGQHYESYPRGEIEEHPENDPNARENMYDPIEVGYDEMAQRAPPPLKNTEHSGVPERPEATMPKEYPQPPKVAWETEDPGQNPRNPENNNREEQLSLEIARLQEELRRKEERLHHIQELPQRGSSVYNRINKSLFDKMQMEEQRRERSMVLDHQLQEREMFKKMEQQEKEYELANRLEDLKRIKEEEMLARNEQVQRAQEYRESLKMQEKLKKTMNREEVEELEEPLKPPKPSKPHAHYINRFTKKTPKTITFDPINGVVRDTGAYVNGDYQPVNRDKTNPLLSAYHNQYKIPTEYSKLPAFQQPMYSKAHPKVMPSFPITGTHFRTSNRDEMPKSRQRSEPKFRGYGSMLMKPEYRHK